MPKFLPLLLFMSTLLACGKSQDQTQNRALVFNYALAETFKTNIKLINFTPEETEKMQEALKIIQLVIGTEEFRDRVLGFTYQGEEAFVDNNGRTNQEIYQLILDGAEKLSPARNNQMDAEVELYYEDSSTVGYTFASSRRIYVNRKYFASYTAAGVAHNLFHEWLHKLGFKHDVNWSVSRDASVPYALGYLMGEIGRDYLQ